MKISIDQSKVREYIEEICARSPRYAGTEGEIASRDYIVSVAERLGINVELEEFEYLHYWPKRSNLEIISPLNESGLSDHPLYYSGSGTAEGEPVYVGYGTEADFDLLAEQGVNLEGKIVVANAVFPFLTYPLAQERGAAGVVLVTDGPNDECRIGTATDNRAAGKIPGVMLKPSAGQRLLTLMSAGQMVLRIHSEGEFSTKTSWNIVMTIPGRSLPEEQVILTAHYDSHNLGKHAWDNATGCAVVLEFARIFKELEPQRTIKAIIFGVEELGPCWGSFAYVERHMDEISKIRAVISNDGIGAPQDRKFELMATKEIEDFTLDIIRESVSDVKWGADPAPLTDHLPFKLQGVPAVWFWGGNLSAFYHTTQDDPDTLDYDKLKAVADITGDISHRIAEQSELPF